MDVTGAVVDVDGTIIRGDEPVPGAREALDALRAAGIRLGFVTNNPTRSPAAVADHLSGMGFSVSPDEVITSGVVTRSYLRAVHPDGDAYVIGEPGLVDQLEGVPTTDDPRSADVLVASLDREFGYADVVDALRALESSETAFVATDPDRTIPGGDGPLPGTGAVLGAIEAATDRTPTVVGKPSHHVVDAVTERLGVDPARCVVVGDRPDTDVALGAGAGMRTILVLTGVTDRPAEADDEPRPDHAVGSIADVPDVVGI